MHIRRQKMHKELRQRDIESEMRSRRMQLTSKEAQIFGQLNKQINQAVGKQLSMELMRRLIKLLNQSDQNENTYILIGNYMLDHPEAVHLFKPYLIENPQCIENYFWVICLMMEKQYNALDVITVGQSLLSVLQQPSLQVWGYYLEVFCRVLDGEVEEEHFPHSFLKGLLLYVDSNPQFNDYANQRIWFITSRLVKYPTLLQKQSLYRFIPAAIEYAIVHLPQERETCLRSLITIFQMNEALAYEYILKSRVLHEVLYLAKEPSFCQCQAIKTLSDMLKQSTVMLLLHHGLHLVLPQCIQSGLQRHYLQLVLQGLKAVLSFLRLLSAQQPTPVQKVKNSMENFQFTQILQELLCWSGEYANQITGFATKIVDQFYTEEIQ